MTKFFIRDLLKEPHPFRICQTTCSMLDGSRRARIHLNKWPENTESRSQPNREYLVLDEAAAQGASTAQATDMGAA
jgi:hypothetical protein